MAVTIEVVHTTIGTAGATQNVTVSGFGTPIGALVFVCAETADGPAPPSADMILCFGATDFTREWCCAHVTEDASDPSQCVNFTTQTKFIAVPVGAGTSIDMEADVTTITDGIQLNWGTTPGTAYRMMVVLFNGADFTCEAGVRVSDTSVVDTAHTVTFTDMLEEPEGLIVGSTLTGTFAGNFIVDAILSLGFGKGPTASILQGCQGYNDDDGRTAKGRHSQHTRDNRIAVFPAYTSTTELSSLELTATGVNGTPRGTFQLTKRVTGATVSYGWFAWSSNGNNAVHIGVPVLDTNTSGVKNYTSPGFAPQFAMLLPGNLPSVNVGNTGNNSAGIGMSAFDLGEAGGHYSGHSSETDPATSGSYFESVLMNQRTHAGGVSFRATTPTFTANGFDFTMATTSAVDKAIAILCIEEDTTGTTQFSVAVAGLATLGVTMRATARTAVAVAGLATLGVTMRATARTSVAVVGLATLGVTMRATARTSVAISAPATVGVTMRATGRMAIAIAAPATVGVTLTGIGRMAIAIAGLATVGVTMRATARTSVAIAGLATLVVNITDAAGGVTQFTVAIAAPATVGVGMRATARTSVAIAGLATLGVILTARGRMVVGIAGLATVGVTMTARGRMVVGIAGLATVGVGMRATARTAVAIAGLATLVVNITDAAGGVAQFTVSIAAPATVGVGMRATARTAVAIAGLATLGVSLTARAQTTVSVAGLATVGVTMTARGRMAVGIAGLATLGVTLRARGRMTIAVAGLAAVGVGMRATARTAVAIQGLATIVVGLRDSSANLDVSPGPAILEFVASVALISGPISEIITTDVWIRRRVDSDVKLGRTQATDTWIRRRVDGDVER